MSIREGVQNRLKAYRNPVYLVYALVAIPIFLLGALVAESGAGPIEVSIFRVFNSLGEWLLIPFLIISLFGTIGASIIIAIIVAARHRYAAALKIFIGSTAAYLTAYGLKQLNIRARPYEFLSNVNIREDSMGTYGFPSGHAAVATVLAITAYQYLPKKWHRPVTILALLVCASRLYLGVHLPMDLVGGFAIGLLFGGIVNFAFGTRRNSALPPKLIKKKLKTIGVTAKSVKLASVDARGSVPYMAELADGTRVFVKVVGRDNNIADWLFKLWRKIVYRRLEDETPFLSPKRQLEHEAYVSYLAKQLGVRTPDVLGVFRITSDRWAHAQVAIDGASLDSVDPKLITDSVLVKTWQQVALLHTRNIVHRDLRCANVFLDSSGRPCLIDFGFSEAGMSESAKNRDRAELIASSATLVGAKRAVRAAMKVLSTQELEATSRYLSYAVLSSASTKAIKRQKGLLEEIRQSIIAESGIKPQKPVTIQRIQIRSLLMILAVLLGIIFVLRQRNALEDSLRSILNADPVYLALGVVFSLLTYVWAAFSYKSLALYPIAYIRMLVIQIASSFASKLVPAGAGGLAVNTRFLTNAGHSITQAGSIAGINNVMGLLGHVSILLALVLFGQTSIREAFDFNLNIPVWARVLAVLAAITALVVVVKMRRIRRKIIKTLKGVRDTISEYRDHPLRLAGSYVASVATTLSYTAALYMSALALGAELTILQTVVVFTVGVATASVTPTPGGIGGAEAGLAAALTGTGLTPELSISIALLYRLLTYWLPLVPGFTAFQYATKREYI